MLQKIGVSALWRRSRGHKSRSGGMECQTISGGLLIEFNKFVKNFHRIVLFIYCITIYNLLWTDTQNSIRAFTMLRAKIAGFIGLVMLANTSHAADDATTLRTLGEIESSVADWVGNGYAELGTYDPATLDIRAELASIRDLHSPERWGDCRFKTTVGRRANIASMIRLRLNEETDVDAKIADLHRRGKIKTILSSQWDQTSGDGVSCSVYYYEIYTTGGSRLILDYKLTD